MEKKLYKIELPYTIEVNEEQFDKLSQYVECKYQTEENFEISRHDSEYRKYNKQKREELKKKRFKEYMSNQIKKVDVVDRIIVVDLDRFLSDVPFLEITIIKTVYVNVDSKIDNMIEVMERFEKLDEIAKNINKSSFNQVCNVHVGGSLLINVNELLLEEDACTDVIQDYLDTGWRMVACCVQPDGRRPDYILGRYNSDKTTKELGKGALRS